MEKWKELEMIEINMRETRKMLQSYCIHEKCNTCSVKETCDEFLRLHRSLLMLKENN